MKDQSKYDFEIKEHIGTIYVLPVCPVPDCCFCNTFFLCITD